MENEVSPDLVALSQSLMPIIPRPEIVFTRGQGAYLFDEQGKRYLDWIQGWAVNCLGHSPAVITKALAEQSSLLINPSPAFFNEPSLKLASLLTQHSCFDHVFFAFGRGHFVATGSQLFGVI